MKLKNKGNVKVVGGIVLYNPDWSRLKENIESCIKQVDNLILFDNGSKNIDNIKKKLRDENYNCILIESKSNKGIAYALNEIVLETIKLDGKWLLTLDQDTVISSDLVDTYLKYISLPQVGQLTCVYKDRNISKVQNALPQQVKYEEVDKAITSGALVNLKVLEKVGGFDTALFIDCVDFEICDAMKQAGYKTYKINKVGMLHELGHVEKKKFLLKNVHISNHSAFRHYYMARNEMLLARRYPMLESKRKVIRHQMKELTKILCYEADKKEKITAIINGLHEGMIGKNERKGL